MKIGLDFDGVISDAGKLKSEGAKRIYGLNIPPEKFKTEIVVGGGLLTLEQYKTLQKQIYGTREFGLLMEAVPGAVEYINKLLSNGYELKIVTSRGQLESEIAEEWITKKGLFLPLISVGGGISKAEACKGLEVYIDDDLDKLEQIMGIVPNRFLFSWGYNEHINIPTSVARRVNSWEDFYQKVRNLNLI